MRIIRKNVFDILKECSKLRDNGKNLIPLEYQYLFKNRKNINELKNLVLSYNRKIFDRSDYKDINEFFKKTSELMFLQFTLFTEFEDFEFDTKKREKKENLDKEILKLRFMRKNGRTFSREETAVLKKVSVDYVISTEAENSRKLNCCYPGKPVYRDLYDALEEYRKSKEVKASCPHRWRSL